MSLSIAEIQNSIYNAIDLISTRTNIFYYPNAPRPQLPYNSVQFLTMAKGLNDSPLWDKDNAVYKYLGFREITYTLNCYGQASFDEAIKLQIGMQTQAFRDKLKETAPISILRMTEPNDLTALNIDGFEERVTFDFVIYAAVENLTTESDVGYFDTTGEITLI